MSSVIISGDTSGAITLAAPAVSGTTTLTLPATTGTVLADTTVGVCRAWVNFNGTGTVAIRASFNVTSITDNGTGQYTVNFTTAMPNADYATVSAAGTDVTNKQTTAIGTQNTSNVQIFMYNGSAVLADSNYLPVAVFR